MTSRGDRFPVDTGFVILAEGNFCCQSFVWGNKKRRIKNWTLPVFSNYHRDIGLQTHRWRIECRTARGKTPSSTSSADHALPRATQAPWMGQMQPDLPVRYPTGLET
jgi:hypothetical protein